MKILILGAGGMLGHKLCQVLGREFGQVYGTVRKPRGSYEPRKDIFGQTELIENVDVANESELIAALDKVRPNVVCNAIGLTLRKQNSSSAVDLIRLNSLLPHLVARWCAENKSKVIHFSTDCVFAGHTGGYTEESVPDAEDLYGRSKLLGEVAGPEALTLRASIIGRELEGGTELLEWFLSQNGQKTKGYSRAIYTGVTTLEMAKIVGRLIREHGKLNGLYQIASEPISKLDLLRLVAQKMGLSIEIEPDSSVVVKKDLVGSRFEAESGIRVSSWNEMVANVAADPTDYPSNRFLKGNRT
ncbi:MAG: SDR family oxidoreductase [Bdellovibrionota bacterium]